MALNPENALVAGRGVVLLGAVGASPPSLTALESYVSGGLVTPPATFTTFGDTAPEDLPEFGSDGGDMTMLSTWAFASVAEIPSGDAKSVYYTVNALDQRMAKSNASVNSSGGCSANSTAPSRSPRT